MTSVSRLFGLLFICGSLNAQVPVDEDSILKVDSIAQSALYDADYGKALELNQWLLNQTLAESDSSKLAYRYLQVGRSHYYFRNNSSNEKSKKYLLMAEKLASEQKDSTVLGTAYQGLGAIYEEQGQYDSAIFVLEKALEMKLTEENFQRASSVRCLQAGVMMDGLKDYPQAEEMLLDGLRLARLAEDSSAIAFVMRRLADYHILVKEYEQAQDYLDSTYRIYKSHNSDDGLLNCLTIYSRLHKATGDYKSLASVYEEIAEINNGIYNQDLSRALAEMETRFETEKKERDNIILRQENENQEQKIKNQETTVYLQFVVILALIFASLAIVIYVNYRNRLKAKTRDKIRQQENFRTIIQTEEKERKRISQELHDGVGQLLSTAKLSLEMEDSTHSENTKKMLNMAIDEVRSVSHGMMPKALASNGLGAALSELIFTVNESGGLKIHMKVAEPLALKEEIEFALYRVIQELIQNTIKHAEAKKVNIDINLKNDVLTVFYQDDGLGFKTENGFSGLGLRNIQSRIELLNGTLEMDTQKNKGTTFKIDIAL
ncbi:MAG: ATP-binding protein [Bacteroidota bacterium]